jgi:hypothetical protein
VNEIIDLILAEAPAPTAGAAVDDLLPELEREFL